LSAVAYAIAVFAVPTAIALVIEAPLFAFADARPHLRPGLMALGLVGMAAGILVESYATNTWTLALGVTMYGPCTGLALNLGEGILVDAAPERVERTMSRLAILANLGDATAPIVILAAGFHGAALGVSVALLASVAPMYLAAKAKLASAAAEKPDDDDPEDAPPEPTRVAIKAAFKNRTLLAWMLATTMCTLLDETLTALAGLLTHERFGEAASTAALIAFSIGAAAGVIALEKIKRSPLEVLAVSSVLCLVAFAAFIASTNAALTVCLAVLVGAFSAPLYPYAKAQAYRCIPGRSGVVNAVFQVFGVIDVAAPVLLALVADRSGVPAALACLGLEPLVVGGLALVSLLRAQGDVATASALSSTDASGDASVDDKDAPKR
jgi:fucose permease